MTHLAEREAPVTLPRNYLQGCILLLVAELPTHGYNLLEQLAGLGFPSVDSGAVYRALRRLNAEGLVESWWEQSDAGPARRRYRLTPAGAASLLQWEASVAASSRSLNAFLDRQRRLREHRRPLDAVAG